MVWRLNEAIHSGAVGRNGCSVAECGYKICAPDEVPLDLIFREAGEKKR
jgi:hypothetical protein